MDVDRRANELYWDSGESVNRIAEELDLSKGALYEMVRPLPAGLGCPACEAEVVYPNRTAKERARVDCPACGWQGSESETTVAGGSSGSPRDGRSSGTGDDELHDLDHLDAPGPPPPRVVDAETDHRRLIVGGALLGAAAGLALVIWARRR